MKRCREEEPAVWRQVDDDGGVEVDRMVRELEKPELQARLHPIERDILAGLKKKQRRLWGSFCHRMLRKLYEKATK
jgi:hypothetical protein